MNRKTIRNGIITFLGLLTISIFGIVVWGLHQETIDIKKLYNAPCVDYRDIKEIYEGKDIINGYQKAITLAADWSKGPRLGKIEIKNKPDFQAKVYRSAIRYVFQYKKTEDVNVENPCDREYHLKEVILTADGNGILKNRAWKTKGCLKSGTSPEILSGEIEISGIQESYKSAIETAMEYLKPIFAKDKTLSIRNAEYSVPNTGFPESWWLQVVNECWYPDISCPSLQIMMSFSKDGKQIWSTFISGTPEYIEQWKHLEYLNPKRPTIKNKKE